VRKEGLSVVIPAYNEEKGIGPVLDVLTKQVAEWEMRTEVIVVDDGSKDDTATLAEGYPVRVVRHPVNRGYGAALKTGIRSAQYETICITDADGTYPNHRIAELYAIMNAQGAEMVVGARIGENVRIPLIRRPPKWVLNRLADVVAGQHIPDLNSGLRLFHRQQVIRFFPLLPNGFSFTTTITLAMLTNGYHVVYEPINYEARIGSSKIRPIRDTLNFLLLILRMALYFAPLKIFLPLSLALFGAAVAWGVFSVVVLGAFADDSTMMILMGAIQVGVLGLLGELINQRTANAYRNEE
jgi:glycosyltransferase involved in cell wall biosynthesis